MLKLKVACVLAICVGLLVAAQAQSPPFPGSFPAGIFTNRAALDSGAAVQNPSQIFGANLIGWWRADQGVFSNTGCSTPATNNGAVACWHDQSGNGCDLTQPNTPLGDPTYLTAGLNSKQTIQFVNASTTNLNCAAFNPGTGTTLSIFTVLFGTSSSDTVGRVVVYNNLTAGIILDSSTTTFGLYASGFIATASIANNAVCRLSGVFDGTNGTTYKQNVQAGQAGSGGNPVLSGAQSLFLGTSTTAGNPWDGSMSELVITNNAATSGQRSSMDSWLSQQWGSATC